MPWMWVLLRPPRFGGANHANHHNKSVSRQVAIASALAERAIAYCAAFCKYSTAWTTNPASANDAQATRIVFPTHRGELFQEVGNAAVQLQPSSTLPGAKAARGRLYCSPCAAAVESESPSIPARRRAEALERLSPTWHTGRLGGPSRCTHAITYRIHQCIATPRGLNPERLQ
jgi:hypothetical protein